MLTISPQQLLAFEDLAKENFRKRMLEHLTSFFPDICLALGRDGVLEQVRDATARAATWGFTAERDVCKYIDLTFALGVDFDTNPDFPWTTPLLCDDSLAPSVRIDRLVEHTVAEINGMLG